MKRNNRDDFSAQIKEILAKRVGFRCSNPVCRKLTSGPNTDPQKATNIGVAAHICAAAPGGARYDASMSSDKRCSIQNGIWLCQNCAKMVDNDSGKYTVSLLLEWKSSAEQLASEEILSSKYNSNKLYQGANNPISTASALYMNNSYANSFQEPLFLHPENPNVCLKNLFVVQKYMEVNPEDHRDYAWSYQEKDDLWERIGTSINNSTGKILILEGNAGCGKTSLIQALNWHYRENDSTSKLVLNGRPLITIRLRDLNRERFSEQDGLLPAIMDDLEISPALHAEERKKILLNMFPRAILVLDGFDELCIIEGIQQYEQLLYKLTRERLSGWSFLVTSRPNYIQISKSFPYEVLELRHFDAEKRNEWIEHYTGKNWCGQELSEDLISFILNGAEEGICDTPLTLYLLSSGKIGPADRDNLWWLYKKLFSVEITERQYDISDHPGAVYKTAAFRIAEEIAHHMYCSENKRLYLTDEEVEDISKALQQDPSLRELHGNDWNAFELVKRNVGLCSFWKVLEGRGAVEFYHNNIRDFFLSEKIYEDLTRIYQDSKLSSSDKADAIINYFWKNLRTGIIAPRVCDFMYLRARHRKRRKEPDLPEFEQQQELLPVVFQRLLSDGSVFSNYNEKRLLFSIKSCVVNTAYVYRMIMEPYRDFGKWIKWWQDVEDVNYSEMLKFAGKELFSPNYCGDPWLSFGAFGYFPKLSLKEIYLQKALFYGSYLRFAALDCCCFTAADFQEADLQNASLRGANLESANLKQAMLQGADLRNACLHRANLQGANLQNAELGGADLREAMLNDAILPDGFHSHSQEAQLSHIRNQMFLSIKL